jgi:hypothetical protein
VELNSNAEAGGTSCEGASLGTASGGARGESRACAIEKLGNLGELGNDFGQPIFKK